MKITICGSIAFFHEMLDCQQELEALGHEVQTPPLKINDNNGQPISITEYYDRRKAETDDASWIWDKKAEAMRLHFDKVVWSEAILVLNYEKNGVADYIGGATLIEIGLAFHLNKKIFFLNSIPEISYKEELLGMKPIIIHQDLTLIK
jgi:hypothetical protein